MRHFIILFLVLAAAPACVLADEVNDTTFTVGNRKIVVDVDSTRTNVKVYDTSGTELLKIKETEFIDGTDIERVFVGSPFVPTTRLQNIKFRPHFPTVWFGGVTGNEKVLGGDPDNVHFSSTKSFQVGVTPYAFALSLSRSQLYGLSAAVQASYTKMRFQRDWALMGTDGGVDFQRLDARAKTNSLGFFSFRLPVVFSFCNRDMSIGFGLAPVLRTNGAYRLKWGNPDEGTNVSESYQLRRVGLDMDMYMGVGPFVFSGSFNLIPMLKTASGQSIIQGSLCLGIDLWGAMRLFKK